MHQHVTPSEPRGNSLGCAPHPCLPDEQSLINWRGLTMNEYYAWDRIEIVRENGREPSETFGNFLPKGTVTATLDNGRVVVKPDGREYTVNLLPEDIRPLA
jgi:hypothetical protein